MKFAETHYSIDPSTSLRKLLRHSQIINHATFSILLFTPRRASSVIVPTLPDFSRHRIGHKQYQSKYHHDRHFGPFFEDPLNTSGTLQVGFHQGTESTLNCRVGMLKDKTVIIFKALGTMML